jgi:uncharacterized Zn finger protein (UPF0148 family)
VSCQNIDIFPLDLFHVFVTGKAETPRICPRCGQLFYTDSNKYKYCPDCQGQSATIQTENRKKNVRYLHKRISDRIRNNRKYSSDFLDDFMSESNYYWYLLRGKDITPNPDYTANIQTENDYKQWLQEKLDSL